MTRTIVCTSQKGGVAKTTTAVSIAHGLAIAGHRVLLADMDPQGHASIALGLDPAPGVYRFFVDGSDGEVCGTVKGGLYLLPGNSRTRTADSVLRVESSADQMIERFAILHPSFDYIVIDTPAGGLFQEIAVRMADVLIIPVRCEALGLDGVAATMQLAKKVGKRVAHQIILPTMVDKRVREHAINADLLRRNYPGKLADAIPQRIAVAEASACGRTVWELTGESIQDVQTAYTALLERIQ